METVQITAKGASLPSEGVTVSVDIPTVLAEAGAVWGDEVALSLAVRSYEVATQNLIRTLYGQGRTPDEIKKEVATWRPGMARRAAPSDLLKKLAAKMAAMTPDELEAVKERIRQLAGM